MSLTSYTNQSLYFRSIFRTSVYFLENRQLVCDYFIWFALYIIPCHHMDVWKIPTCAAERYRLDHPCLVTDIAALWSWSGQIINNNGCNRNGIAVLSDLQFEGFNWSLSFSQMPMDHLERESAPGLDAALEKLWSWLFRCESRTDIWQGYEYTWPVSSRIPMTYFVTD